MTTRLLARELGAVLECDGCETEVRTAQILKTSIRVYAESLGWGRGLRKGTSKTRPNGRNDYCPECMKLEHAHVAERKKKRAERIAKRDAKLKALDAKIRDGAAAQQAAS